MLYIHEAHSQCVMTFILRSETLLVDTPSLLIQKEKCHNSSVASFHVFISHLNCQPKIIHSQETYVPNFSLKQKCLLQFNLSPTKHPVYSVCN